MAAKAGEETAGSWILDGLNMGWPDIPTHAPEPEAKSETLSIDEFLNIDTCADDILDDDFKYSRPAAVVRPCCMPSVLRSARTALRVWSIICVVVTAAPRPTGLGVEEG